ncbi:sugar ABC transporter ATP-binding protein [Pseudonocardia xishanensis]|uniref:Sugar ABC transporter ATP-binding protein n=1 Tax=Pseudonocardia xishanensis TaxID=630995 RepID=A0ABP8RUR5_9PSEU
MAGLSKTFPGTRALQDFSIDLHPGRVHALVGQNGSGKSTFIKVLAGFHAPDPGAEATMHGAPLRLGDPAAAYAAGLRFVHQDLGLVMTENAMDNLALGVGYRTRGPAHISWRAQEESARSLLTSLGHEFDVTVPVERLSAVERTTLAIARAMQGWDERAGLLVLDEPTATMPARDVDRVHDLVRRVTELGSSVLYVSHHLQEVFDLAHRVTVLRDGREAATLDIAETTPDHVVELMTGGIWVAEAARERKPVDGDPVLEIRGLACDVLDALDLEVRPGEVVGVAGIDGSGRDEVAGGVFGSRTRRGTVRVAGVELAPDRPHEAVGLGVGLVPRDRHADGLVMEFSVLENLTLARLKDFFSGLVLRTSRERSDVEAWIDRLRIKGGRDTSVNALSGGNQQKVVIGKWLRLKPRVLLLEEPTQGVDIAAKEEVHVLIEEAAQSGAAVLVCSSDEAELVRLCSRVLVLSQGRVVADLAGAEIREEAIIKPSLGIPTARDRAKETIG